MPSNTNNDFISVPMVITLQSQLQLFTKRDEGNKVSVFVPGAVCDRVLVGRLRELLGSGW